MRNYGDCVVLRDLRRDVVVTFGRCFKQDMFDQTFFSQNKTFKVVWREKPQFSNTELSNFIYFQCCTSTKVHLSTIYCCLQAAGL